MLIAGRKTWLSLQLHGRETLLLSAKGHSVFFARRYDSTILPWPSRAGTQHRLRKCSWCRPCLPPWPRPEVGSAPATAASVPATPTQEISRKGRRHPPIAAASGATNIALDQAGSLCVGGSHSRSCQCQHLSTLTTHLRTRVNMFSPRMLRIHTLN